MPFSYLSHKNKQMYHTKTQLVLESIIGKVSSVVKVGSKGSYRMKSQYVINREFILKSKNQEASQIGLRVCLVLVVI